MPRRLLLLTMLSLGLAGTLTAQVTLVGKRDLDFGTVMQGVATAVAPTDPVRSGWFEGVGILTKKIRLTFTLPTRLNGPAGATMPITFRTTDGVAQDGVSGSPQLIFNPNVTTTFVLNTNAKYWIFLGGQVNPSPVQTIGSYTATVILTVVVF